MANKHQLNAHKGFKTWPLQVELAVKCAELETQKQIKHSIKDHLR